MIKFATDETKQQVWDIWKTVFGDPNNYMEVYFRTKYKNENTLLYFEGDKAVASLQLLPYNFTFYGAEIPVLYLSGVSTLSDYRKKGYMQELMVRSLEVAHERGYALMLLIPQEEWLLKFYDKYGFIQTFEAGEKNLTLLGDMKGLMEQDMQAAYSKFDAAFRHQNMTVQKTFEEFIAIVDEAKLFDYPVKGSTLGMARVLDAERLLSLFAQQYPDKEFSMDVEDELLSHNNKLWTVANGRVEEGVSKKESTLNIDVRLLAQLLLGFHTSKLDAPLSVLFPEQKPQMHYMME